MNINNKKPEEQKEFPTKVVVNEGEDNPLWVDKQENEQNKKDNIKEEGKRLNDLEDYLKKE